MKVKFTATQGRKLYNGDYTFSMDGQVRDLPDAEAKRLVETWPDNFAYVTAAKMQKPKKNKMVKASDK